MQTRADACQHGSRLIQSIENGQIHAGFTAGAGDVGVPTDLLVAYSSFLLVRSGCVRHASQLTADIWRIVHAPAVVFVVGRW